MRKRDVAAAVLTVVVWGLNFVAIDKGLQHYPPLLFVALRYLFVGLPAVFFVPRPAVGWRTVAGVALFGCVGQFGGLFVAMHVGLPAGLASVGMQSQALFTVLFAAVLIRERPSRPQLAGLLVAAAGLGLIAVERRSAVPATAFLLMLVGAASWGAGNVVTRRARPTRPLSLLVYGGLAAVPPLLALSAVTEGPARDLRALRDVNPAGLWSLAYVVVLSTFLGFGIWYSLLARYESAAVAPFGLLVPVVGLTAAWAFLSERPTALEVAGSAVAVAGIALVILGKRPTAPPALAPELAAVA